MTSLNGRIALVTGGSRGIGLAIAGALARDGATVGITGLDEGRLGAARAALERDAPGRIETFRADVRQRDEIAGAVDSLAASRGGLDILVNNAGVGVFALVAEMTDAAWQQIIDTNLTGVFHACRAALPHLVRRGDGFIINISSLAGQNPFSGGAAYCASKAALNAFGEALMQEVRYDGVRVSTVLPGSVSTSFSGGDANKGADWKISPEEVADVVLNLLRHPARSMPSRVELRPSKPRK
jgi:NAD(P)-dependent dehydrogenase (short-subunit alcohol dehydrogenase family)